MANRAGQATRKNTWQLAGKSKYVRCTRQWVAGYFAHCLGRTPQIFDVTFFLHTRSQRSAIRSFETGKKNSKQRCM